MFELYQLVLSNWDTTPYALRFAFTAWLLLAFMYLTLRAFERTHGINKEGSRDVYHHNWPVGVFVIFAFCVACYYVVKNGRNGFPFFPNFEWEAATSKAIGLFLIARGLLYALAGRITLNGYWAQGICKYKRKEDNKIVASGIYSRMRHPIYAGQALMSLGTFLTAADWSLLLLPALVIPYNILRGVTETRVLTELHGKSFSDYRVRVPPLAIVVNPLGWPSRLAHQEAQLSDTILS